MLSFFGKGVYGAIAVGRVYVLKKERASIRRTSAPDTKSELERVERARATALAQLREIYERALDEVGTTNAQIFEIHMMMLEDEDYNESIKNIILTQEVNAEYAVSLTAANFSSMFLAMGDSYMQARATDVKDISDRLISCMTFAHSDSESPDFPAVICADDLTPSETVLLDKERILAFVTAHGSANSHTAILARSMDIPAVIGVGDELLSHVSNGDTVAVDGFTGEVVLNPDKRTLRRLLDKKRQNDEKKELLKKLRGKESVTLDGRRIDICANIGGVEDIGAVLANDADGVGLFRSEFLYLEGSDFPDEQHQLKAYKQVLVSMSGKKVIIRTLDIGADKNAAYFNLDKEENPALGLRAIRICLTRPEIFKTQLRALMRASVYGRLGIMFPMITSVEELERVLEMLQSVKNELDGEGIAYSNEVELGIMIETPAAALISDRLAQMVDFFSVGTNDLTQYTLACDRQNPALEQFCNSHHEAIIKLIKMSADNAHANGAWIGICGELAADTSLTEEFIRIGIDELSVSPPYVLKLRDTVRRIKAD